MLWLAGLMGMMVLGSIAVVTTGDDESDAMGETGEDPSGEVTTDGLLSDAAEAAGGGSGIGSDGGLPSVFDSLSPMTADLMQTEASVIEGGDGDDALDGTAFTDLMSGGDGDDMLDGAANDDDMRGGDGADSLHGGTENDTLHGEAGADALYGDSGNDALYGHDGDDDLYGGTGNDELQGGLGNDALFGGDDADALHGREGADTLVGGSGADALFGGAGADLLSGVALNAQGQDSDESDYLNGNDGDDTLVAGAGDVATGGDGADTFVLGDWAADSADAASLADFDAEEDQLVIVYDDSESDAAPDVQIQPSADDPDLIEILVNGSALATVHVEDAPQMGNIALVGASVANTLFAATGS